MARLFTLATSKVSVSLGAPKSDVQPPRGRCRFASLRAGAVLEPTTWRWGVPDEVAADARITDGPMLFEETTYSVLVEGAPGTRVGLMHRDPGLVDHLSASSDGRTLHGPVNFRSYVGRSRFTVLVDGAPEFDFEVEVSPSKLDYKTDYAELTAEVQEILHGLVLQYLSATFEGASVDRGAVETELEWVLLLRHLVDELEQALLFVAQRPKRALRRTDEFVRIDRIRRSDSTVRQAVLRGRGRGRVGAFGEGLRARHRLPEHRARPTLDTPEHRWLAARVAGARRRLAAVSRRVRAQQRGQHGAEWMKNAVVELDSLEGRLGRLLKLEPLRAVEGPPPQGFASLQLQGSPGYREAYHACVALSQGLRLTGGPVELSLKRLHQLYEYWCYLATVRLVADILDEPIPVRQLLSVDHDGLLVRLKKGRTQSVLFRQGEGAEIEVVYSPKFSGSDFLLSQEPDISLSLRRAGWPNVRLVMDAKYRLDDSEQHVRRMGVPAPPADAINVLHRYRDAILEPDRNSADGERGQRTVVEGVALYPLTGLATEDFEETELWRSLERLGIGALPFLPSEKRYVRSWLESVLRRTGWTVADRAIPSASRKQLQHWREAASEPVYVGGLRPDSGSHISWIREQRAYYAPLTPTQPLQLSAKWVGLYEGASGSNPSSVSLVARVESLDVMKRQDIDTPWPASAGTEGDDVVVYRLEGLESLDHTIRHPSGSDFTRPRWTSRLALERARALEELLLETEPEWRLYDELRILDVEFTIRAGRPRLREADNPIGRAWFDLDERGSARFEGLAGWRVRRGENERHVPNAQAVVGELAIG